MNNRKQVYKKSFKFAYYVSSNIVQYLFLVFVLCLESITYDAVSKPTILCSIGLLAFSVGCVLYVDKGLNNLQDYSRSFHVYKIHIIPDRYISGSASLEANMATMLAIYGFMMVSPTAVLIGLLIGQIIVGLLFDFHKDPSYLPYNPALILVNYKTYVNFDKKGSGFKRIFAKTNVPVTSRLAIPFNPRDPNSICGVALIQSKANESASKPNQ